MPGRSNHRGNQLVDLSGLATPRKIGLGRIKRGTTRDRGSCTVIFQKQSHTSLIKQLLPIKSVTHLLLVVG